MPKLVIRLLLRQERPTCARNLHLGVPASVMNGRLAAEYLFTMSSSHLMYFIMSSYYLLYLLILSQINWLINRKDMSLSKYKLITVVIVITENYRLKTLDEGSKQGDVIE